MPLQPPDFRKSAIAESLRRCQLFREMPAADLEEIAAFVVGKRLAKGEFLFREGEPVDGFYVVQRGAINVHRVSPTGKEQVLCVFPEGHSFAEAALASAGGYPASARAIEDSVVLLVPKRQILDLLSKRPDLALKTLGSMSRHLQTLVALIGDLALKGVEARVASWLLKNCGEPLGERPVSFDLGRTKRVLAAELGTAEETLSRTLGKFRARGLVRARGRAVTVVNPRKLGRLVDPLTELRHAPGPLGRQPSPPP